MLQLRETLEVIEKRYAAKYSDSNHFVAVYKPVFYAFAIDSDSEVCLWFGELPVGCIPVPEHIEFHSPQRKFNSTAQNFHDRW